MQRKIAFATVLCFSSLMVILIIVVVRKSQEKKEMKAYIMRLGHEDKSVSPDNVSILMEALKDEDYEIHVSAARALGKIGEPAIYTLIRALKSEDVLIRRGVVFAIGFAESRWRLENREYDYIHVPYVPGDKRRISYRRKRPGHTDILPQYFHSVIPALREASRVEDDKYLRREIFGVLAQFGELAVPVLIEELRDEKQQVPIDALEALEKVGDPAVPALTETLSDDDQMVREYAITVLKLINTPKAWEAIRAYYEKQE